jgi:hypothetical protein
VGKSETVAGGTRIEIQKVEMSRPYTEKPSENITKQALFWNPQGKRKKGRPRNTLRCEMESETKRIRRTWKDLEKMTLDRGA